MRHYDTLLETQRGPYTVIVDKTWEDLPLDHLFDTSIDPDTGRPYYDIHDMYAKIEMGDLDYFMLRTRVFYEGVELSSEYLGGMLYEDAKECLTDGSAEDQIWMALESAKKAAIDYKQKFAALDVNIAEDA
jgi:hypothetical protein